MLLEASRASAASCRGSCSTFWTSAQPFDAHASTNPVPAASTEATLPDHSAASAVIVALRPTGEVAGDFRHHHPRPPDQGRKLT